MDLKESLRIEVKPQRLERCSTDFHCSYERLCSSKSLAKDRTSITNKRNGGFPTHSGYRTERNASKSLHCTSPNDIMMDRA